MGRPLNTTVHAQFDEFLRSGLKEPTYQCKHCGEYRRSKSRLTNHITHLRACTPYLLLQKQQVRTIEINPAPLTPKKRMDLLVAEALIACGLPFNTFDPAYNPAMSKFLAVLNPSYTPLGRKQVGNKLLNVYYDGIKQRVEKHLAEVKYINFSCDKSSSNNGDRVFNLSANVMKHGSYHLVNRSMKTGTATAKNLAEITRDEILRVISLGSHNDDFPRANSITTDTCTTMRAVHRRMEAIEEFKDTFFVLCDSHGFNLLCRDLLQMKCWANLSTKANQIATYFKRAKRALAIIYKVMKRLRQRSSFVLAVITRWGSHYGVVRGLLRGMMPLKKWVLEAKVKEMTDSNGLGKQIV